MNLYQGMNMNPVNYVDPLGEYVKVKIDKKTSDITLDIPIEFKGDQATPVNIARIIAAINRYWTGEFDGYNVTANARVATRRDKKKTRNVYFLLRPNTEYSCDLPEWLKNFRNNLSYGKRESAAILGGREGVLYTPEPDNVGDFAAAHETGHLIGVDDKYEQATVIRNGREVRTSRPMPGYENNIMADSRGTVDGRNITELLKNNKKLKKWKKIRKKVVKKMMPKMIGDITEIIFGGR